MTRTILVYCELQDAIEGDDTLAFSVDHAFDRADAVNAACDHFWSNNDGWEWMRDGCTLYSVSDGGVIFKHEVGSPDFTPNFYAPDGEEETRP